MQALSASPRDALPVFLYGPLSFEPLLKVVLGDESADLTQEASISGYSIRYSGAMERPSLVVEPGCNVAGLLLSNLSDTQRSHLEYYAFSSGYILENNSLEDGTHVELYILPPPHPAEKSPWDFAEWQHRFGALSVIAAQEIMSYHGRFSPEQVLQRLAAIYARAGAQLRAAESRHGARTLYGTFDVTARRRAYSNFYALDELVLQHETFDGGSSEPLDRAVFVANDAAVILPYDPVRDRVLLVEQIRLGPIARGDQAVWQLEPIAGRIDGGETPEEAAHREAQEEAGLTLKQLIPIAETYASPGNATEFHYIFIGLADLPDEAARLGGAVDEAEDIRAHLLSFEALMTMIEDRQAANAPLVLAALWLGNARASLRADA